MSTLDLFPDLLLLAAGGEMNDEQTAAFAAGLVQDWFGTLSYTHNESTHNEILESLNWPGMPAFVRAASAHMQDEQIDFDDFAAGVRWQARRAKAAGLVVKDGKLRVLKTAASATGDLFSDDESEVPV